jgi:hypothetical protein
MSKQSRLTDTTLTVNASSVEIDAATTSAVNVYGDVSMNSRLFVAGNATASRLSVSGSTVTSYIPTPITTFEQYTINGTWSNAAATAVTVYYTRINNLCTVIISGGMQATGTNVYNINTNPPSRFAPTRTVSFPINVEANGSSNLCYCWINTNGTIYAPSTSGVLSGSLSGPNAGAGTFWTINFPSISYYVA